MVAGLPLPSKPGPEQTREQGRGGSLVRLPALVGWITRNAVCNRHSGRTDTVLSSFIILNFPCVHIAYPSGIFFPRPEPPLGMGAFVKHC